MTVEVLFASRLKTDLVALGTSCTRPPAMRVPMRGMLKKTAGELQVWGRGSGKEGKCVTSCAPLQTSVFHKVQMVTQGCFVQGPSC